MKEADGVQYWLRLMPSFGLFAIYTSDTVMESGELFLVYHTYSTLILEDYVHRAMCLLVTSCFGPLPTVSHLFFDWVHNSMFSGGMFTWCECIFESVLERC